MSRMTKEQKQKRTEAIAKLREMLPPGSIVYTSLDHVSRSGMMRVISCYRAAVDDKGAPVIEDITYLVGRAIGESRDLKRGGLRIGGGGMDMGFHIVYSLSRTLWQDNFVCTGKDCRSNDHSNGDRDYSPHKHSDGGHALTHRWL